MKRVSFDFAALAWICAFAAFFPVAWWLFSHAADSFQLRDALLIMVSAAAVLAVEFRLTPHRPSFGKPSLAFLAAAYAAFFVAPIAVNIWGGWWSAMIAVAGFTCVLVSAGAACFDNSRFVYAVGGGFYAFCGLSVFARFFDFPLRLLAGKTAEWFLSLFNKSALLMLYKGHNPQIGLMVDGTPYLVATECNGFGIIGSSIVLSLVLSFFRKDVSWLRKSAAVLSSALIAFAANALRITCIVSVAPLFAKDKYMLVHEFFGYLFFALALLSVWMLSRKGMVK